ncbi:MAG: hypothetical protein ABIJ75_02440 [Actinomycetota bacterium]
MSLEDDIKAEQRIQDEIESQTRFLRHEVAELTAEGKELRKLLGFYEGARKAAIAPPTWEIKPRTKATHAGLIVAQLTDCHFDEIVRPEEIMGLNAYNREIALIRFRKWTEKVVTLPRDYFAGVRIEGLVIPATGDILSGDIHAELKESNEDHLLASVLFWVEQVIASLQLLEAEYAGRVSVHAVVGNHGRTTVKPVFKGRAHSNVEWLLWTVVRDRLADRKSAVRVEVSDSMDLNVPLYGRNHLLTHGDQFQGGTGISGAYAPLCISPDARVLGADLRYRKASSLTVGDEVIGFDEFSEARRKFSRATVTETDRIIRPSI